MRGEGGSGGDWGTRTRGHADPRTQGQLGRSMRLFAACGGGGASSRSSRPPVVTAALLRRRRRKRALPRSGALQPRGSGGAGGRLAAIKRCESGERGGGGGGRRTRRRRGTGGVVVEETVVVGAGGPAGEAGSQGEIVDECDFVLREQMMMSLLAGSSRRVARWQRPQRTQHDTNQCADGPQELGNPTAAVNYQQCKKKIPLRLL